MIHFKERKEELISCWKTLGNVDEILPVKNSFKTFFKKCFKIFRVLMNGAKSCI